MTRTINLLLAATVALMPSTVHAENIDCTTAYNVRLSTDSRGREGWMNCFLPTGKNVPTGTTTEPHACFQDAENDTTVKDQGADAGVILVPDQCENVKWKNPRGSEERTFEFAQVIKEVPNVNCLVWGAPDCSGTGEAVSTAVKEIGGGIQSIKCTITVEQKLQGA